MDTQKTTAGGRNGMAQTRGLLPSSWLERGVRLEYVDAYGSAQETSGILLDLYPFGPILNLGGARTAMSWDRLTVVELVED